jgi:hypothetical protein
VSPGNGFEPAWIDQSAGVQVVRQHQPWTAPIYAGGRNLVHDPRSRDYRADVAAVKPRDVVHRHYGDVLDQLKLGSCTGNSGRQCLNCEPLHRPGERIWNEDDAIDLYSGATRRDPWAGAWPPDDTGSSGLAVGAELVARGEIDRYEGGFGIDDALKLATAGPISVGSEWTDGMFDPDRAGFIHPTGAVVGGHQWTIRGISWREEWVLILNSWGYGWGGWIKPQTATSFARREYPGHARMRFTDLEELVVARRGDVVRFVRADQDPTP